MAAGIRSPTARCIDPSLSRPDDAASGLYVASIVLGQSNFINNGPYLPASVGPGGGLAIDKSVTPNRLYFADPSYNRILAWNDAASFSNGQAADLVLGQADFFSVSPNPTGINAGGLNAPVGIAVDSAGNVYVADGGNNRVLEYNTPFASCSSPPCVGPAASVVFGQGSGMGASGGDFTTSFESLGKTGLDLPFGVALDSHDNLFVADMGNSRVLEYDAPLATPTTPNVTANRVYGQGSSGNSFDTRNLQVSQTMMLGPIAVALDSSDNLFASDGASRVCEYDTPLTNFTMTRVFGQGAANNFNSADRATTQSGMKRAFSLAFDTAGDLFVSDFENARVLEFIPPFPSGSSIVNAAAVWGQGTSGNTFTTSTCYDGSSGNAISASTMCSPAGVALDTSDNLYVGDFNLKRILRFQPATNGTPPPSLTASATLGQAGLTIFNAGGPARAFSLALPTIAIDKTVTPNRLYAADGGNNRVLAWNDIASATSGQPADLVIGQPDFELNGCNDGTAAGDVDGVGADSLCFPVGLAVDLNGNLYVADTFNNRVLEYKTPFAGCSSLPCVGPAASFVIGQTSASDFTGTTCAQPPTLTASGLCLPDGVAFDAAGNLYVGDESNCRVLEYSNPQASPSPNVTADLVFGQGSTGGGSEFTTNVCADGLNGDPNPTANSLALPAGVAFDKTGNMYVADGGACRVLEYNTPLANPAAPNVTANTVWGQAGKFTTAVCSDGVEENPTPSATGLGQAVGVALDVLDDLYIADLTNNRVLEFNTPLANPSAPNLTANAVYGQGVSGTDFTDNTPAVGQSGMNNPGTVAFDSENRVLVGDGLNNRVLIFPQTSPPSPVVKVGRIVAPKPANKGVLADKTVEAGSFKYTNLSGTTQQITSITVTVTKPDALVSLMVSAGNTSGSISPVFATTTIPLTQALSVPNGETVKFELTAVTAAASSAAIAGRAGYASIVAIDHSPVGSMGGGLMLIGLMLLPLSLRQRRRVLVVACLAIGLMVAAAGCGGTSQSFPSTTSTRSVNSAGTLSNPAKLSIITVFSGNTTTKTVQSLTSVTFGG